MYWGIGGIYPVRPNMDSPYASWPMFRESMDSVPPESWCEVPAATYEVRVCVTGDYSTRINSFFKFDGPCDLSFPILPEWTVKANQWVKQELWERACSDPMRNDIKRPYVLMHIPTQKVGVTTRDPRYCDPDKFVQLYSEFRNVVRFFDVQRVVEGENELLVTGDMSVLQSNGADVTTFWALTDIADVVVTTDNHMLPLALALNKPLLYLAGNVSVDYLLDPRIDRSNVEIVAQDEDPVAGFERMVARL
jgi:hypothetical protein